MRILVLGGGDSNEREISLRSADNIKTALLRAGFDLEFYDPQNGIGALDAILNRIDLVFPILHGAGGEDGTIQEYLEAKRINYLGSRPESCRNSFDKWIFRQICQDNDILVPKGELVTPDSFVSSPLKDRPFVLKPVKAGSSIDTFIIHDPSRLPTELLNTLERYGSMLLEELIEGHEITVGILDQEALPVIEIIPPAGEEFDYENKYNGKTREIVPSANISEELQVRAQEIAFTAHQILGARHWSRVDMILNSQGMFTLELNSIPGMTEQSLYPKAAAEAGYDMPKLVSKFIELARN